MSDNLSSAFSVNLKYLFDTSFTAFLTKSRPYNVPIGEASHVTIGEASQHLGNVADYVYKHLLDVAEKDGRHLVNVAKKVGRHLVNVAEKVSRHLVKVAEKFRRHLVNVARRSVNTW